MAVLASGALAILGVDVEESLILQKAASARARIWLFDGATLTNGPEFPLLNVPSSLDRFPDGRWLLTDSRLPDTGRILSSDGSDLHRIGLGRAIDHLKIDANGNIWVGWSEEADESDPIDGTLGVTVFRDDGSRSSPVVEHAPSGLECSALNIDGAAAWANTYGNSPILKMTADEPGRWWSTTLVDPGAIAVCPTHVLAAGGHEKDRATLLRLDESQGIVVREWRLPFGLEHGRGTLIDGRGDTIHYVRDSVWYRWRIADFVAIVSPTATA